MPHFAQNPPAAMPMLPLLLLLMRGLADNRALFLLVAMFLIFSHWIFNLSENKFMFRPIKQFYNTTTSET